MKLLPAYVEVWEERELVARHERSFSRYEQVLDLEHYLDVLETQAGSAGGIESTGSSGANAGVGRRASTGCGRACRSGMDAMKARER